jgi:hypothetical protein
MPSFRTWTPPKRDPLDTIEDREVSIAFMAVRLYAVSHPRPSQVTRWQAAEMLGVSSKTVARYIQAGLLKVNDRGRLPIEAIDKIRSSKP